MTGWIIHDILKQSIIFEFKIKLNRQAAFLWESNIESVQHKCNTSSLLLTFWVWVRLACRSLLLPTAQGA